MTRANLASAAGHLAVAAALLLLLMASACNETRDATSSNPSSAMSASPKSSLPDRDPALAHRLVEREGGVLLDVRTPQEYQQRHIEGAHNIPYDELEQHLERLERLTDGNASKPIVVYCRSGRRSGIAKKKLLELGHDRVTNLGGIGDW